MADVSGKELAKKKQWETILRKYLAVYLLATLSDWLQGPYVYALYADYGFSQHEIAILFVAGFGSSMVFGSFIGGMADWGGRRNFVVLYAIVYGASCVTKRKFTLPSYDSFLLYAVTMFAKLLSTTPYYLKHRL